MAVELFPKIERISPVEEEVFKRLMPKFKALRIDMDEFEGVYSREEIDRDKRNIETKKAFFESDDSPLNRRAQILEALLAEQIELSEWFGSDALTIVPSEYDDFYHGVDLAVEFQQDDEMQHVALGIDVTTSQGLSIFTKLTLIKGRIEQGELTEMKYFTSESQPDLRKRKTDIPSLVIGADPRTINELANLWLTIDKSKNPGPEVDQADREELRERARNAQHKLASHRAQVLILKQIELQLGAFTNLARKKGPSHQKMLAQFERLLGFVKEALSKKKLSKSDEITNESDDVFRSIKVRVEELF